MPSPFPGMDPYLEAPEIWPDFHDALATYLRAALNTSLPAPYYARLEMRPEVGVVEDEVARRRIIPDVAVLHPLRRPGSTGATAVVEMPRAQVSPSIEVEQLSESIRHHFVEIRDPTQGHRLITLIEIVSPSNKRPGPDRDAYQRKQREVLESDASLIELDLLRTGERLLRDQILFETVAQREQPPAYLVVVNRAWRRGERCHWQLFPIGLRELLPCIAVPLRESEPEVTLDLQHVFNRAYDDGPYHRGAVNYVAPPRPPLADADAGWAAQRVAVWLSTFAAS